MNATGTTETFQERVNRENAERLKAYEELYTGVGKALECGVWKFDRNKDPDDPDETSLYRYQRWRLVYKTFRLDLSIVDYGSNKGKVRVTGSWPQDGKHGPIAGPSSVNEVSPSIQVSLSRGYAAIAADIERRFLPEYRRIYVKLQERLGERQAYEAKKLVNWNKLIAAGVKPYANPYVHPCSKARQKRVRSGVCDYWISGSAYTGDSPVSGGYGTVTMESADSVRIDLRSIPVELAAGIIDYLKSAK